MHKNLATVASCSYRTMSNLAPCGLLTLCALRQPRKHSMPDNSADDTQYCLEGAILGR